MQAKHATAPGSGPREHEATGQVDDRTAHAIRRERGGGKPLDPEVRSTMEGFFATDFGRVRVHEDATSHALTSSLQARAFTTGPDIFFRADEYRPRSPSGLHLLAHEMTHVVQQGAAAGADGPGLVQCAPLTAKDVLSKVETVDFLKDKLEADMAGEAANDPNKVTVRMQVEKALDAYLKLAGGNDLKDNAVMLSIALDGAATAIAESLHDPWVQPRLAKRLAELYQADLGKALAGSDKVDDDSRRTAALAGVLLTNDPVGLYMHGELAEDEAARRVVLMANDASGALRDYAPAQSGAAAMKPTELYDLLRHRFEAQMLAFTRDAVKRREDTGRSAGQKGTATRGTDDAVVSAGGYSTREATGRMSVRYFNTLFKDASPSGVASFTKEAKAKLDGLATAVTKSTAAWGQAATIPTRDSRVSQNEERALQAIEGRDSAVDPKDVDNDLTDAIMRLVGCDKTKAESILASVKLKLTSSPVTITVPGSVWFGKGVPKGEQTKYRAATSQKRAASESEVFGKEGDVVQHVGAYTDEVFLEDRGEEYLRFRVWKDRLMSQNLGLSPEEMPKYGALNLNWDMNYGASSKDAPKKSDDALRNKDWAKKTTAERKATTKLPKLAGENYYGDVHLVLKDAVRKSGRVVFTSTDHGAPHADPLLALRDAATGAMYTNLSSPKADKLLLQAMNAAAATPANLLMDALTLEAQIYGEVDLAKDVAQLALAPHVSKTVAKNAEKFCKKNGIPLVKIAPDDPKLIQADLFMPSKAKSAL